MRTPPTGLANTELATARYGDFGRTWLEAMWHGDEAADAVVTDLRKVKGGQALLRRVLDGDGLALADAPASLQKLHAEASTPPEWLDPAALDRASGHLARHAPEYGVALAAASLLAGANNAIASKPLLFTGRYASDAGLRSTEVGVWLTAVTTPGGLAPGAEGWVKTLRVRLIHSQVRAHLEHRPEWLTEEWGAPIPQPYMAFTLAEFGSVALRAMHQLGVRYTESELADIYHLWRYVGALIGVEPELIPTTARDHQRIEELYALTSPGPDEYDQEFVEQLSRDYLAREISLMLPGGVLDKVAPRIVHGLARAFLGREAADALAIPDTPWKHLPRVLTPLLVAGYGVRHALPGGKDAHTERSLRTRLVALDNLRQRYGVAHELVDDVAATPQPA